MRKSFLLLLVVACALLPDITAAQGLTGTLIGTVKDEQGGVLAGASVRVSSSALIGGAMMATVGHQREHLSHRRHELYVSVQRRGARRTGRRLHSGSASAVCRRIG